MDTLGGIVGKGATADVYEYGDNKVAKLYITGSSIESVKWEFNKALSVCEHNLPAPKVYELIERDNRFGFVMERIQGDTLTVLIERSITRVISENHSLHELAEQIFEYIRLTARFMYDIHSIPMDLVNTNLIHTKTIETIDDRLKRDVHANKFLTEDENNKVIHIIDSLPKGNSVCHGDPNPNNIIVRGDHFVFIDWVNCGIGNPMYDIAEYVLLLTLPANQLPEGIPPQLIEFFHTYKDLFVPTFLEEYEKISEITVSNYQEWFVPLLVSKLNSNRTIEEKNIILEDIRKRLN